MLRRGRSTSVLAAGLLLLVCLLAVVVGWRAQGGRWYVVASASMGRTAPVGSLLLTRPVDLDDVRTGDVITFRSPAGAVYSHRVVGRSAAGLATKGDINPVADAWTVTQPRLIGRVVRIAPGLGWVLRGLPLTLLVAGAFWLLSALVRDPWRISARLVSLPAGVSAAIFVLHPWVGLTKIADRQSAGGRVALTVVSTGVLPVHVRPVHHPVIGSPLRLVDGQVGSVWMGGVRRGQVVGVDALPDLSFLGWVVVALLCLSPLILALGVGMREPAPILRSLPVTLTSFTLLPARTPALLTAAPVPKLLAAAVPRVEETTPLYERTMADLTMAQLAEIAEQVAAEVAADVAAGVAAEVADDLLAGAEADLVERDAVRAAVESAVEPAVVAAVEVGTHVPVDAAEEMTAQTAAEVAARIAADVAGEVAYDVAVQLVAVIS